MPDMTMCAGTEHPVCIRCFRRIATPGEFVQSYFTTPQADAEGNCDYFLEAGRDAAVVRTRDYEDDYRAVVNEQCAGDEKHCTCVPHLRTEIERLRGEVEGLRWAYNTVTDDCRNLTEKVIPNIRAERDAAVARYEYVRRLNVQQFKTFWDRNLAGERFDDMVDAAIDAAKEGA